MPLHSAGTGVVAWFIFMIVLRRLLAQPELLRQAKLWAGVTMVLTSSLFALAVMFALAVSDPSLLKSEIFFILFSVFLALSAVTGVQISRRASS